MSQRVHQTEAGERRLTYRRLYFYYPSKFMSCVRAEDCSRNFKQTSKKFLKQARLNPDEAPKSVNKSYKTYYSPVLFDGFSVKSILPASARPKAAFILFSATFSINS